MQLLKLADVCLTLGLDSEGTYILWFSVSKVFYWPSPTSFSNSYKAGEGVNLYMFGKHDPHSFLSLLHFYVSPRKMISYLNLFLFSLNNQLSLLGVFVICVQKLHQN